MNYREIISFLKSRDLTMVKYDRKNYDEFLKSVNFSINFPFIHVAGTNGKSSLCHYLSNIYLKASYKVGSFIKPFLGEPIKMISYLGENIKEGDFARIFTKFENQIIDSNLTSFEIECFVALSFFNEVKPDLVIIECGMGGLLDATNILDAKPLLSIISSVSLEHVAFLGKTIKDIALQKSGIIKKDAPVLVSSYVPKEALSVIAIEARKKGASLYQELSFKFIKYESPYFHFSYGSYLDLLLFTNAYYEIKNASLAIEAIKLLRLKLPVSESSLREGLLAKCLPARLERRGHFLLDGAHNEEAIKNLIESLSYIKKDRKIVTLFASYKDKNISHILPLLKNVSEQVFLTTFPSSRARKKEDYVSYLDEYSFSSDFKLAINNLLLTYPDDWILITGSLDFAYQAKKYILEEFENEQRETN